jgi:hypothetical protein
MTEKKEQKNDTDPNSDLESEASQAAEATAPQKSSSVESLMHGLKRLIEEVGRVANEVQRLADVPGEQLQATGERYPGYLQYLKYLEYLEYLKYLKPQTLVEPVSQDEPAGVRGPLEVPMWNLHGRDPFPIDGQGLPAENGARVRPAEGPNPAPPFADRI